MIWDGTTHYNTIEQRQPYEQRCVMCARGEGTAWLTKRQADLIRTIGLKACRDCAGVSYLEPLDIRAPFKPQRAEEAAA